jgi:hypothetical protein
MTNDHNPVRGVIPYEVVDSGDPRLPYLVVIRDKNGQEIARSKPFRRREDASEVEKVLANPASHTWPVVDDVVTEAAGSIYRNTSSGTAKGSL